MTQFNTKKALRGLLDAACQLLLVLSVLTISLLSGCSIWHTDSKTAPHHNGLQRNIYASTGLGASRLSPDNSEIPTWTISDKVNAGAQITLGADINRHLSIELHSTDLGSAGVEQLGGSQRGRINYHQHGGSALWYAGKNRDNKHRAGFTGFGRAGVTKMHNSSVGDAPYAQKNSNHLLIGAGVEYSTEFGLGVRAEIYAFNPDAQYAQLGLIYRHVRKTHQAALSVPAPAEKVIKNEEEVMPPPMAARHVPLDSDKDGIIDSADQCPSTKFGVLVDVNGCAMLDGVLEGVNFYSASKNLTPKAKSILDEVAHRLKQHPNAMINVDAHTDKTISPASPNGCRVSGFKRCQS